MKKKDIQCFLRVQQIGSVQVTEATTALLEVHWEPKSEESMHSVNLFMLQIYMQFHAKFISVWKKPDYSAEREQKLGALQSTL